jgi:heme/copper-type cytochrome/quinol oxidase subunit 2
MAASAATAAQPAASTEESDTPGRIRGTIDRIADVPVNVSLWLDQIRRDVDHELTSEAVDRDESVAHNLIGATITVGISLIMMILMMIVAGYFVAEAPSNGTYQDSIDTTQDIGGTAFILLGVSLLAVPVVAIVGYFMRSGLGGFIVGGGMGR